MRHAEALLLVDHDQPEVGELHILANQPVRADQDVDLAGAEALHRLLLLLRGFEAADRLDVERVVRHPLLERAVMLLGEHGGWHEDRDLLTEFDGLECGAHRQFRFAVTHVAAEEAIHRARALHVLFDVLG
jgi:hypothetical protein